MKTNAISPKIRRKRRFLLFLPAIILPFLTLLFWVLGGGKGDASPSEKQEGLRMHLPRTLLERDSAADKMSFYDRARADSDKQAQLRKTDPNINLKSDTTTFIPHVFPPHQPESIVGGQPAGNPQVQTDQINRRLAQLQAILDQPEQVSKGPESYPKHMKLPDSLLRPQQAEDPELKQMSSLLDKIQEIQHPERMFDNPVKTTDAPAEKFKAVPAIVDGNQKIIQGTVIRMKLLDSVTLNGQLFSKGQLIYGSGDLYNQRVKINIKQIHAGLHIFPVDLRVYDRTDGMEGICVPEAVTGDALRDGAVAGMQNMELMNVDPTMAAQLATAGINTARGLFSKKIKRVKGKLKNGHALLLRNNQLIQTSR